MSLKLHYKFDEDLSLVARKGPTLTITRATEATFVDYNNIIKTVQAGEARYTGARRVENLALQSQFAATWATVAGTLTANNATDPDGGATAATLAGNAVDTVLRITLTASAIFTLGGSVTKSCYVKPGGTISWVYLAETNLTGIDGRAYFDVTNGTVGTVGADVTASGIIDAGDGWYRCWYTILNEADDTGTFNIYIAEGNGDLTFASAPPATDFLAIWGHQLENVSGQDDPAPSEYIPTTTAAVSKWYATKRRTNLLVQSNDFDTTWVNVGTTEAQDATDRSGVANNAWTITAATSGFKNISQNVTFPTANTHTVSVYAKKGTFDWLGFAIEGIVSIQGTSYFDLANGVVGTKDGDHDSIAIEAAGNGFYRCSVTVSPTSADLVGVVRLYLAEADSDADLSTGGTIIVQDSQLERGYAATAYIPTTTTVASSSFDTTAKRQRLDTNVVDNANWEGALPLTGWSRPATDDGVTAGVSSEGGDAVSYRFQSSAGREFFRHNLSLKLNTTYTLSFFVEAIDVGTGGNVIYLSGLAGITGDHVSSGAIQITPNDLTAGQRFSTTFTTAADGVGLLDVGAGAQDAQTHDITLSAFQIEEGIDATAYIPVAEAETSASAVRLVDFPGVRVEEERTNICLQSSTYESASWTVVDQGAVSADTAIAPDGTLTADTLLDNAATGIGQARTVQLITIATSTNYVLSRYFKANGLDWARLGINSIGALNIFAYFDLTNGVVGATVGSDNIDQGMVDAGNGWWRCWVSFLSDAVDADVQIAEYVCEGDADFTVPLDGGSSIYVWGADLQAGHVLLNHIPTTTASVTKNIDNVQGIVTAETVDNGTGTWYVDASLPGEYGIGEATQDPVVAALYHVGGTAVTIMEHSNSVAGTFINRSLSGVGSMNTGIIGATPGSTMKGALRIAVNDCNFYLDGVAGTPDVTTVAMDFGDVTRLNIGSYTGINRVWNGDIAEIAYYDTPLDDATLEGLSSGNISVGAGGGGGGTSARRRRRANDAAIWNYQQRLKREDEEALKLIRQVLDD